MTLVGECYRERENVCVPYGRLKDELRVRRGVRTGNINTSIRERCGKRSDLYGP